VVVAAAVMAHGSLNEASSCWERTKRIASYVVKNISSYWQTSAPNGMVQR